jgi:leader peptidase (prepilin peptidase)/N-methyltransferase
VLELFADQPGLFTAFALVLGLLVGSFLNVVIHRVPRMLEREWREQCAWLGENAEALPAVPAPSHEDGARSRAEALAAYNLWTPASACPQCGHGIAWYENIPILSWLFLRGRCSACGAAISWRYPLVEALTGLLFAYAAWHWGLGVEALLAWCLLAALIALSFIDLDTRLLPDNITLPLAWAGLLVNLNGVFVPLEQAVIGAVAGYLCLWGIYHLFKGLTGKEGMGFGDFKLLAALGAWLGWKMLLPIVLVASLAGALVGIAMIILGGHDRANPIPFGPWLALGGVIGLFWGDFLVHLWLG